MKLKIIIGIILILAVLLGLTSYFGVFDPKKIIVNQNQVKLPEKIYNVEYTPEELTFNLDKSTLTDTLTYDSKVAYKNIKIKNTGNQLTNYFLCFQTRDSDIYFQFSHADSIYINPQEENYLYLRPSFYLMGARNSLGDLSGTYEINGYLTYDDNTYGGRTYCDATYKKPLLIKIIIS